MIKWGAFPPGQEQQNAFLENPYTDDQEQSLSEIISSFNERYGTEFSRDDFLRFEKVNQEIMDEEMKNMMRNNPADVVYSAFSEKFFQALIKSFQLENEIQNIFMKDPQARELATKHFFSRAQSMIQKN